MRHLRSVAVRRRRKNAAVMSVLDRYGPGARIPSSTGPTVATGGDLGLGDLHCFGGVVSGPAAGTGGSPRRAPGQHAWRAGPVLLDVGGVASVGAPTGWGRWV